MGRISKILIYPIKGFPSARRDSETIISGGTLEHDRKLALFDSNSEYINGRSHQKIFQLEAEYDLNQGTITLKSNDFSPDTFKLAENNDQLEEWLSNFFGENVELEKAPSTNYTDSAGGIAYQNTPAPGPSLIGEQTLREVASWFDGLDFKQMLRRLRANLIIQDVPPFWEDQLWTDPDHLIRFQIGDCVLEGVAPLPRCSVPSRDPDTGEGFKGFIKTFVQKRRETLPDSIDSNYLKFGTHYKLSSDLQSRYEIPDYYFLGAVTRIPRETWGKQLTVGERIEIDKEVELVKNL